jgi:hypothetical protein
MVRSPLVWLGEPDPVASIDASRAEDPELSNICEFFDLWLAYEIGLDTPYTTADLIEFACRPQAPNNYNPPVFKLFLLRVAASKGDAGVISPDRLGWWLRKISGRVVNGHRLVRGRSGTARPNFQLSKIGTS